MKTRAAFLVTRLGAALALLVACTAIAQGPALIIENAWLRATPGSDVAAAYFTVRNPTPQAINIVGVESPVASHAMIHESQIQNGQSQMRAHEQLVVPPGQTVKLEPGGLHVMLHGLAHPLTVGQNVPLVLSLADGRKLQVAALVRPLDAQ